MIRRVLALLLLATLATGCDYREILRIHADGRATLRLELDITRDEYPEQAAPFVAWDGLVDLSEELDGTDPDARESRRQFLVELLELEGTEPWIDESLDELVFDVDQARLQFGLDWTIEDITGETTAVAQAARGGSIILTDVVVEEHDDGTITLASPAHLDGERTSDIGPSLIIELRIEVPGALVDTDAHTTNGSTAEWRWRAGERAEGIVIEWDPTAHDDGCELCSAFAPLVMTILVLFGLLGLGVLVASLGLVEAWRVTRRDRRDIARDDESP